MKHAIKWGLIFTLASLLWMAFERVIGLHDKLISQHGVYTNLFAIPAIIIFFRAIYTKRRDNGGHISFKEAFIAGLLVTLVVTIMVPVVTVITQKLISPDFFPNMKAFSVQSGEMTMAEAENYFSLKNYIVVGIIGGMILGILTSAFMALILQRKPGQKSPLDFS
jgi:hypothetical protein